MKTVLRLRKNGISLEVPLHPASQLRVVIYFALLNFFMQSL